ncbi:nuclear transport factor 2 family protein [Nocardia uniformis]|uniref:Nuclear transport factor 2 family protein n=1 Tax=Nocardia uniformis TaxID=53432 RepID=A0A849C1T3_9NOCA|nr:nuclear transport factor 2 family protein [Nocardia uniformis]NNH68959.1 nuclear transport factor 2 family protein [Nocardia uniformis]
MTERTASPDLETFTQIFQDWDKALVANDPERIAYFTTPSWTFVGQDGPSSGSNFLDAVRSGAVSHDTMSSEVRSVRVVGDTAVVIARVVNTGSYQGRRFENDEWTSDVFLRRDGRWLCELTHLTPART